MSSPAGSEDFLFAEGWRRLTDGPYLAAWHQFWGKDIELTVIQPWKTWNDALLKRPKVGSQEVSICDLARSVLGGDSDTDVALPSCTFFDTPWSEKLSDTKGRIMIPSDYNRIYGRIDDLHAGRTNLYPSGVIIEGQSGIGKTYLSLYLLAIKLSSGEPVIYSPHADSFVFFNADGVLVINELEYHLHEYEHCSKAIPKGTWIILDTCADEGEPTSSATEGYLFSVQLCRPEKKYFDYYIRGRDLVEMLVVKAPSPLIVLAGALVQVKMQRRGADLERLLSSIRDFGTCLRNCYLGATRQMDLYESLRVYISGLSDADAERYPILASRAYDFPEGCLRPDTGPDIFSLRRDYYRAYKEAALPVIASRYVMGELRRQFTFASLYEFREMTVIREPLDLMDNTRLWLFEHLCHALFSEGGRRNIRADLSPCFSDVTKHELLLEHIFRARPVQSLEADLPQDVRPEFYFILSNLCDTTFHSLSYLTPYLKSHAADPERNHVVTRGLAKRLAFAAQALAPAPAHITRGSKRARDPLSSDLSELMQPRAKRPRLRSETRFVVVYQMLLDDVPVFSEPGLQRLERLRSADPFAQYFFVFVTMKGQCIDLNFVPEALRERFKWYHLRVDFDLYGWFGYGRYAQL